MKGRYGEYLWKNLSEPYNRKYWCVNLGELGIDWIGSRIYQPELDEFLYGTYTGETPNTYYAAEMRYPKRGGYCSFVKRIVQNAEKSGRMHYNKRAASIDIIGRSVCFEDGTEYLYDKLYSSVPLPEIVRMLKNVPDEMIKKTEKIEHTGIVLVSFGMKQSGLRQMWFYIYDEDIMAARAYMPSVKSEHNAPGGCESIQFEIYFNSKDRVPDEGQCIANCIYALEKMGICNKADILFHDGRIQKYGNVILKEGTRDTVKKMTDWLQLYGIECIGRFGRWEYLWSDQAFMSGYNAAIGRFAIGC